MTAGEVAAVVAAVAAVGAFAVLLVGLVVVTRSLTLLRLAVEELRQTRVAATLVTTMPDAGADGGGNGAKPVPLLTSVVLSDPVIKAVAAASGTARAVRAFKAKAVR